MSRHPRVNGPDPAAWSLDLIRVTAFPVADAVVTPETWWKDLLGEEASSLNVQRTHFLQQEQGEALGGVLTLSVGPGRIEWNLVPKIEPEKPPRDFPSLGRVIEGSRQFVDLILRWVPSCPAVGRIALGLNAWVPAPDHTSAYQSLDALLPSVELDPASSDFRYQINRPRTNRSGLDGLLVNRLMSWSAVRMALVSIGPGLRPSRSAPLYACRAELDINTAVDFEGPLPVERIPDLLREFLEVGLEILREGDQP